MISLVFFAFTTILGWCHYSEKCLEYLTGGKKAVITVFRILYIAAVFIGPYMTVSAVWTSASIFNGLMAIPNMIAMFAPVSYTHLEKNNLSIKVALLTSAIDSSEKKDVYKRQEYYLSLVLKMYM